MTEQFHSRVVILRQGVLPTQSPAAQKAEMLQKRRLALSILTIALATYVGFLMVGDSGFKLEHIYLQRLF